MALRPVTIEEFPGLDLRRDPGDSRGAIDLSNVTLEQGSVRTRDGSSLLLNAAGTNQIAFLASTQVTSSGFGWNLIVEVLNGATNLQAVNAAGTVIASTGTTASAYGGSGVAMGGFYFYATAGTSQKWNGTAWSTAAGNPINPNILSLSPIDNRLVLAGGGQVFFSDPGVPGTWGANNYVYPGYGDGEVIVAAAVFNNQTFLFKNTKFYVFYGTSTDSTGSPIFNYRTVDTGIGVRAASSPSQATPGLACASEDGVYFVGERGIYRTTGVAPVLISAPIQPFFDGTTGPFWQGTTSITPGSDSLLRLAWLNGRLYFSTGTGIFVWDRARDVWTYWNLARSAIGTMARTSSVGDIRTLVLGGIAASNPPVTKIVPGVTTDNAAVMVSRYRLPFETYGNPAEKRIREVIVEGSGSPTVGVTADWSSTGITKALTLGTSPAIGKDRMHNAWRGRALSLQLGAASGAWSVNRVQANVADATRPVSVTV